MHIPPSLICVLLWSIAFTWFVKTDAGAVLAIMLLSWVLARILFPRRAK